MVENAVAILTFHDVNRATFERLIELHSSNAVRQDFTVRLNYEVVAYLCTFHSDSHASLTTKLRHGEVTCTINA